MSAATILSHASRLIAAHGETMTLGRTSEGTTISVAGKRTVGALVDVGNGAAQQRFRVKIGTVELLASAWTVKAPKRKDTLAIGGKTRIVEDVRPLNDGATTVLYELEVAG